MDVLNLAGKEYLLDVIVNGCFTESSREISVAMSKLLGLFAFNWLTHEIIVPRVHQWATPEQPVFRVQPGV